MPTPRSITPSHWPSLGLSAYVSLSISVRRNLMGNCSSVSCSLSPTSISHLPRRFFVLFLSVCSPACPLAVLIYLVRFYAHAIVVPPSENALMGFGVMTAVLIKYRCNTNFPVLIYSHTGINYLTNKNKIVSQKNKNLSGGGGEIKIKLYFIKN